MKTQGKVQPHEKAWEDPKFTSQDYPWQKDSIQQFKNKKQ